MPDWMRWPGLASWYVCLAVEAAFGRWGRAKTCTDPGEWGGGGFAGWGGAGDDRGRRSKRVRTVSGVSAMAVEVKSERVTPDRGVLLLFCFLCQRCRFIGRSCGVRSRAVAVAPFAGSLYDQTFFFCTPLPFILRVECGSVPSDLCACCLLGAGVQLLFCAHEAVATLNGSSWLHRARFAQGVVPFGRVWQCIACALPIAPVTELCLPHLPLPADSVSLCCWTRGHFGGYACSSTLAMLHPLKALVLWCTSCTALEVHVEASQPGELFIIIQPPVVPCTNGKRKYIPREVRLGIDAGACWRPTSLSIASTRKSNGEQGMDESIESWSGVLLWMSTTQVFSHKLAFIIVGVTESALTRLPLSAGDNKPTVIARQVTC